MLADLVIPEGERSDAYPGRLSTAGWSEKLELVKRARTGPRSTMRGQWIPALRGFAAGQG